MATDAQKSADVPTDVDRLAPALVRLERLIAASPHRLWLLQAGVGQWPSWQKDIQSAALAGTFAAGESFTWTTAGLDKPIVSTLYAVEAEHSMLWGGPSAGIMGIHRWSFEAVGAGTKITTEESWAGPPVDADPPKARTALEVSLGRWLTFLEEAVKRG